MENIRGSATSAETIATVVKLALSLDKISVLVGNCDGFVVRLNILFCQTFFFFFVNSPPGKPDVGTLRR